jgi:SAM-dependent methyltransferase
MSGDDYLAEYQRANAVDLSGGIGGWLRSRLDRLAASLGQRNRHALFLPRALELSGLTLVKPLTILEVGCGSGWAISYRHPQVRYVAVDRGSVYRTELEGRGVEFHEKDVTVDPLPVANGSVDLVILNHLIEHIAEYEFFMWQLRRILRPGGIVYIRTPNLERVKWGFWDDYTHVKPYTLRALDQLMSATNFERRFMLYSDHPRISLDILTEGRWRGLLFSRLLGGKEIEAGYVLREHA